ncbi:MAG TPA: protein kinase, partial [Acidimicrobiales bacterium]|nr:protein kinase [Acidimicrobiales bacterium]
VLDASAATVTGTTLGTAAYMAPEQLAHHRVGTAADIWALGVVLLECLTGKRAFEGPPAELVARRLAGATPSAEGLATPWRVLVASMLDPDPARRPEADEVAGMLGAPAFTRPSDPRATAVVATAPGPAGEPTLTTGPPTALAPAVTAAVPAAVPAGHRNGRRPMVVGAVAGAAAGIVILAALAPWALTSGPAKAPEARTATTTAPPSTSTSTTPSTTTTTQVTSAGAAASLVDDVEQAEASGALPSSLGRLILDQLGQALGAAANGNTDQASSALGAIDRAVTDAGANGDVTAQEESTLLSDVSALAAALGAQDPAATTTTVTAPPPGPGPAANGAGNGAVPGGGDGGN